MIASFTTDHVVYSFNILLQDVLKVRILLRLLFYFKELLVDFDEREGLSRNDVTLGSLKYVNFKHKWFFTGPGRFDPGIRSRIFHPMFFDHDNFRNVNGKFVHIGPMVECDTSWKESVFHNFKDYIR